MAYTATTWVEGVTTLGPTNMNKIETELVYLDTRIPAAALGYATTLPGSPVDGQEAILVDSTTNPTFQWRFRFNNGNSTAYKWELVGGVSAEAAVATDESLGATTGAWLDATTVGPSITVARAGIYRYDAVAFASTAGGPVGAAFGVAIGAGTPASYSGLTSGGANLYGGGATSGTITLAAGNEARLRYIQQGGSTHVATRVLHLIPVRVS